MIEPNVVETLSGFEFCVVNDWNWRTLDRASFPDCNYGVLHIVETNPLVFEILDRPVSYNEINSIQKEMTYLGSCEKAMMLFSECLANCEVLFSSFDFSEEGKAALFFKEKIPSQYAVNAMFKNIILSGKRLIDRLESMLGKIFGEDGAQYLNWKNQTGLLYDETTVYAFCYDIRNRIEHDDILYASAVNVDPHEQVCGFAINLENELFDTSLKSATKEKLREFLAERKAEGCTPWMSLSRVIKQYEIQLCVLYTMFIGSMIEGLICLGESPDVERKSLEPANCIVCDREPLHESDSKPAKRVYKLWSTGSPELYLESQIMALELAEKLRQSLEGNGGE